ncbi:MAG: leucine-rich repeat domain-containing protein, partial [Lachnoclostridium sp.]|nr:leucine-rich repeat domain-containing protein [Lachnoclostridium sp.]
MKKKIISILIIIALLVPVIPIPKSLAASDGDWNYLLIDGSNEIRITKYNGFELDVEIPEEIDGKKVVDIDGGAFDSSGITSVKFPETLRRLGVYCFRNCDNLTEVVLPDSLTEFNNAFRECDSLTTITLGNGLENLPQDGYCFGENFGLIDILVKPGNQYFTSDNGILYNKDKTKLIKYPAGRTEESFTVPDFVTTIGEEAFQCTQVKSIEIGNQVKTIKNRAFAFSKYITDLTIPAGVEEIGDYIFGNSEALQSVTFQNPGTYTMGLLPFNACFRLKTVAGALGSPAEEAVISVNKPLAEPRLTFLPIGKPITIGIRKDDTPVQGVMVTDEDGEVKLSDNKGEVYFPVTFDNQKTYRYLLNINDSTYPVEMDGFSAKLLEFRTVRVIVEDDGMPVEGAVIRVKDQIIPAKTTDASGMVELVLYKNVSPYTLIVETDGKAGEIQMHNSDYGPGGTFYIEVDVVNNPMITGKITHNGNGISGVVLTAEKENEKPLYAQTKVDGSYRFILPKDD